MSTSSSTAVSRIVSHETITPRSITSKVVAAQHDADDVLADVVDVAFDGGQQDLCAGLLRYAAGGFFRFHERA